MKRCTKCILPETFPNIKFDNDGVCNYCHDFDGLQHLKEQKIVYRKKFEDLFQKNKGKNSYDGIIGYSGGKDSTYTLAILKEKYNFNSLAVTIDNGFIPEQTLTNIRHVVENLGVDHMFIKPRFDMMKTVFRTCGERNIFSLSAIKRASSVCTACISFVKFSTLRIALEKKIPFIVYGWSPGQVSIETSVMKMTPQLLKMMQKPVYKPLYDLAGEKINPYFLEDEHFVNFTSDLYNVSPLAFFDYNAEEIFKHISQYGWTAPKGIDAHSTNCELNSYANISHKKLFNYDPYVYEVSGLVRTGSLSRSEAMKKIEEKETEETVEAVKRKLGIE